MSGGNEWIEGCRGRRQEGVWKGGEFDGGCISLYVARRPTPDNWKDRQTIVCVRFSCHGICIINIKQYFKRHLMPVFYTSITNFHLHALTRVLNNLRHHSPLYQPALHLLWHRPLLVITFRPRGHADIDPARLGRDDLDRIHALLGEVDLAGVCRVDLDGGDCAGDLDLERGGGCDGQGGHGGIEYDGHFLASDCRNHQHTTDALQTEGGHAHADGVDLSYYADDGIAAAEYMDGVGQIGLVDRDVLVAVLVFLDGGKPCVQEIRGVTNDHPLVTIL